MDSGNFRGNGGQSRGGGDRERRGGGDRFNGGRDGRREGGPRHDRRGGGDFQERRPHETPSSIPSPYNFIPLAGPVFFPDWAGRVSPDVPFKDGLGGVIELSVTAKTPVFTGEAPKDGGADGAKSFFQFENGQFFIPAQTLRGAVRSALEIITFGKLSVFNDRRFSVRDFSDPFYTDTFFSKTESGALKCRARAGWLSIEDGKWTLTPCSLARVEQELVDRDFGLRERTVTDKHEFWMRKHPAPAGSAAPESFMDNFKVKCSADEEKEHRHSGGLRLSYRKVSKLHGGDTDGFLVFTAQPAPRSPGRTGIKHMEFVFFGDSDKKLDAGHLRKCFSSRDNEWRSWRKELRRPGGKGRAPVFYLEDESGAPVSAGLAMTYRIPAKFSVGGAVANANPDHARPAADGSGFKPDMAELIFGHASGGGCLKSRVFFGHLGAEGSPRPAEEPVSLIFGRPDPSYYPNYLEQETDASGHLPKDKVYMTYSGEKPVARGWKRYPVRADGFTPRGLRPRDDDRRGRDYSPPGRGVSALKPLPAGTVFTGKIVFNNLRPPELGALMWALTWGGSGHCRHSAGAGKPFGLGSVKIDIASARIIPSHGEAPAAESLPRAFEEFMESQIEGGWRKSARMRELLETANATRALNEGFSLSYPSAAKGANDFGAFKAARPPAALQPYSKFVSVRHQDSRGEPAPAAPQRTPRFESGIFGGITAAPAPAAQAAPADDFASFLSQIPSMKDKVLRSRLELMLSQRPSAADISAVGTKLSRRLDYHSREQMSGNRDYWSVFQKLSARTGM
jgi:CRISPR-associated protein (TIGR03986 family)